MSDNIMFLIIYVMILSMIVPEVALVILLSPFLLIALIFDGIENIIQSIKGK